MSTLFNPMGISEEVFFDDKTLIPIIPFAYSQIERRPCNNYLKRLHKPKHRRWGSAVEPKLYFLKEEPYEPNDNVRSV